MNAFDRLFQPGTLGFLLMGVALTAYFVVQAVVDPEHRYVSLFLVLVGLAGVSVQYGRWRRKRAARGLDLLGPDALDPDLLGPDARR